MRRRILVGGLIACCSVALVVPLGCRSDLAAPPVGPTETQPPVPGQVTTTQARVSIATPDFGNRAIAVVSAYGASSAANTGQVSVPVSTLGTQLLIVRDAAGIARGLTLSTVAGQVPSVTTPNAQSTATALLFLTPGITTVDTAETRQRIAALQQLPCYGNLVSLLATRLASSPLDQVIESDLVAAARASCSASLSATVARAISKGDAVGRVGALRAAADPGLSFISIRESISGDGNHLFEAVSNTGFRVVDVLRWQPPRDAKGVAIATTVQMDMVGAQAANLADVFSSGDPTTVTDDVSGPAAPTLRYYVFGPGLFDNATGTVLPAGLPARGGVDDARLFGESILQYSIGPLIELALGAKVGPAEWSSKLNDLWNGVKAGIDVGSLVNRLHGSTGTAAVKAILLEAAKGIAHVLTDERVLQKVFPKTFEKVGVLAGLADVLDLGLGLGNIGIMAGTFATAQTLSVVDVTAPATHLVIPTPILPIAAGQSRSFGGTLVDVFGNPSDEAASVDWHNLNADVAFVDLTGQRVTTLHAVTSGTATIIGRVRGVPTQVAVTVLKQSDVPQVGASPTQVDFVADRGGAAPATRSVQITNTGGGDLGSLTTDGVSYSPGETTGWLTTVRLNSSTAPTALVLGVSPSTLPVGSYHATVTVRGSNALAADHPATVSIVLSISTPAAAPKIVLDQSTLTPSVTTGQTAPTQIVNVSNGGTGTLSGLTIGSIVYGAGQPTGWITPSWVNGNTTAPATLSLSYSTSGLAAGTYSAILPILSGAAGIVNSPQNIAVTLVVGALPPRISVSPSSAAFAYTIGGTAPAVQSLIQVANTGGGSLTGLAVGTPAYQGGQPTGWLTTASLNTTTAPATLTLGVSPGTLAAGTYHATLPISATASGVANSPQSVAVDFVVSAAPSSAPRIVLDLASLTPSATQGQTPAFQTVGITNGGTGSLTGLTIGTVSYGAGQPTGWVTPSWAGGNTTAPATLTLTYSASTLAAGTYSATVPISSTAPGIVNSPQTIAIALTVGPRPPTITVNPNTATFAYTIGGASPSNQSIIQITNTGGGSLSGLAVGNVGYQSGQPTGWLATASLNSTTAPATLTLGVTAGSLAAGTYHASIPITSTAGGVTNSPQTVAVDFIVTAAPASAPKIALDVSALSPTTTVGQTPPLQVVNVTNSGTGTLSALSVGSISYGSGQPTGWIAPSWASGITTAPAVLSLAYSTSNLAVGTYTATVPVTSSASGVVNSPQNVAVTLTVGSLPPKITLNPNSATFAYTIGGSVPTSQSIVQVSNTGGGTLNGLSVGSVTYQAGQPTGWLNTASLNATAAPATLTLGVNPASLAAGTYHATVPIASSASGVTNSPQTVAVDFIVSSPTPAPSIALDLTSLTPSTTQGQPAPFQLVNVTNGGTGTLSGLSVGTISYGAGQPTGWITTNWTSGTTAPTGLSVSYAVSGMQAGTYSASIPVVSTAAGVTNSPRSIGVVLTIAAPPAPLITSVSTSPNPPRAGVQFNVSIGGSNFNPQNAQMVFVGPGCPQITSCVVPNGVLTAKSATSISGPATLASGDFSVQVQNGANGPISNIGFIHVP